MRRSISFLWVYRPSASRFWDIPKWAQQHLVDADACLALRSIPGEHIDVQVIAGMICWLR